MREWINNILGKILRFLKLDRKVYDLIMGYRARKNRQFFEAQLSNTQLGKSVKSCKHPLFCCLRNEMHRMPFFLKYYRNLGVDHFFFIDNGSEDGFQDYIKKQKDCSVWLTTDSYKASNFGMEWCNILLEDYGTGKWCLTVDPDEFFVYPKMETRNLIELTQYLDSYEQPSVFSVMIDAYGERTLNDAVLSEDLSPFEVCPYFDRYNYTQQMNHELGSCWVQGGVRKRLFFKGKPEKAPAQNKVPLIKWKKSYKYLSSMHHTNTPEINCSISKDDRFISGAIFHFKYVSALADKIAEEMQRKEHYDSGNEYKAYKEGADTILYDRNWSVKYENTNQLLDLKFIHCGEWF